MEIPDDLGLSATEQASVHQQWDTYNEVLAQVAREGFKSLGEPPFGYPEYLDLDTLTSHDSRILTREFAKNKAWKDFAEQRCNYYKMMLTQVKNELSAIEVHTKKRLREGNKKKVISKDEVADAARTNPRYQDLGVNEQRLTQFLDFYDTEIRRFAGNISMVSRAITVRGQNIEETNRQTNVGGSVPGGAPPRF
jgi:hypothetical protein